MSEVRVPFFRPELSEAEIQEVTAVLRSGWLTTGPKVRQFEQEFAAAVCAKHAIALNSCTAALHLGVEALGLSAGQAVLVPTMTFAATAEIVRYQGAYPVLVDCDPVTLQMDFADAERKMAMLRDGLLPGAPKDCRVVGIAPVHVGGAMLSLSELRDFAERRGLWIVEDAAHAFPAAWRADGSSDWIRCGQRTASVTCYSFYANKTITTGEGGMAVTDDDKLAERIRLMSLHGLSKDAWSRYSGGRVWDYRILAPGYKYNLTDVAAALGIHQLRRAEEMRLQRAQIAQTYYREFAYEAALELPENSPNLIHSWHLFPVKLRLDKLDIDRNTFMDELKERGVDCSVHWRPLHLHNYYSEGFGWKPSHCPAATQTWERLVSLPLFSSMRESEIAHVVGTVREACKRHAR